MTVYQLSAELGIPHNTITGIISRNHLPYTIEKSPTRMGMQQTRHLPKETIDRIREHQRVKQAGHGLEVKPMTQFFKVLILARRRAGKPINVGAFMKDYRDKGWRDA